MALYYNAVRDTLMHFERHQISLAQVLLCLLDDQIFSRFPFLSHDVEKHASQLLSALKFNTRTSPSVSTWANLLIKNTASSDVLTLAQKDSGWHFSAANAQADQILAFQIEEMAMMIRRKTPDLWSLICGLLTKEERFKEKEDEGEVVCEDEDEAEYWVDRISDEALMQIEIGEPRLEGATTFFYFEL